MKKSLCLGEYLYILARHEKGSIKTRGIWGIRRSRAFREALDMMGHVVEMMASDEPIQRRELDPLLEYARKNQGSPFPVLKLHSELAGASPEEYVLEGEDEMLIRNEDVTILMKDILSECETQFRLQKSGYKERLGLLLQAFHYLPRVFLPVGGDPFFNLSGVRLRIGADEAMAHANEYLARVWA